MKNKISILLIDDEKSILDSCSAIFVAEGYDVETALSGAEGIKKASQREFDTVITDYRMKEMDGLEVIRIIHNERPYSPVIMITGYSSDELRLRAEHRGFVDYIIKPFTPDEIIDAVRRAVDCRDKVIDAVSQEVERIRKNMGGITESQLKYFQFQIAMDKWEEFIKKKQ